MKFSSYLAVAILVGVLAAAGIAFAAESTATSDDHETMTGPRRVSAHPDLLERLGRKQVARLQAKAENPTMLQDIRRGMPDKSTAGAAITGTGTSLAILWDFTDHPANQAGHPNAAYGNMMFSTGTYPTGSMNDYYLEVSHGVFGVNGTISGWTTDTNTYASYANPDLSQDANTAKVMLTNAIAALDATIDFSQFDNDGPDGIPNSGDDDGNVDSIFFVHAGPGEEQSGNAQDIWSHAWGFWPALATNDGVNVFRYSVEPEEFTDGSMITVGVFAHEYGHVLGLPDLYDTDYSSQGIGQWGLMSGGSWTRRDGGPAGSSPTQMTAWSKIQLGWVVPMLVVANAPGMLVQPAESTSMAVKICPYGNPAATEYFLVENRRRLGFDEGLTRRQQYYGLPDPEGLIIYHVDDNQSNNADDAHRLVDVVDASPWFTSPDVWHENLDAPTANYDKVSGYNPGDNGDLWPGFSTALPDESDWLPPRDRVTFSDNTIPGAGTYECAESLVAIDNIQMAGADVTFDVYVGLDAELGPVATNPVWDFEVDADGWQYCNSKVHHDFTQSQSCAGTGGLWFGQTGWAHCGGNGYGNNWNDFKLRLRLYRGAPGRPARYPLDPDRDFHRHQRLRDPELSHPRPGVDRSRRQRHRGPGHPAPPAERCRLLPGGRQLLWPRLVGGRLRGHAGVPRGCGPARPGQRDEAGGPVAQPVQPGDHPQVPPARGCTRCEPRGLRSAWPPGARVDRRDGGGLARGRVGRP